MPERDPYPLEDAARAYRPTDDRAELARVRREAQQLEEAAVVAEAWGLVVRLVRGCVPPTKNLNGQITDCPYLTGSCGVVYPGDIRDHSAT